MGIAFGIDVLLGSPELMETLADRRIALAGNPASTTFDGTHAIDALIAAGCNLVKAFGPQHGMRGDVQDNMIETDDYVDPRHRLPIISLYGKHHRPTAGMLADIDVILFDLQDVGCRIYTYSALLRYFMEALHGSDTEFWILDRPNPAGRPVDGLKLEPGHESIVGFADIVTRHGLTLGEMGSWLAHHLGLDVNLRVIRMDGWQPDASPGYGWPVMVRPWINPSPNASNLNMARCFPGTVLLEGTELSEGRGTTTPLELIGAPDFPAVEVLERLKATMPQWTGGVIIRPCFFEPTFHKHQGQLCAGLQFHTDSSLYEHDRFVPYRLIAGLLKSLRQLRPDYPIWRHHEYEYELDRVPIDVISGGLTLRRWVDDDTATFESLESRITKDVDDWLTEREPFLLYK